MFLWICCAIENMDTMKVTNQNSLSQNFTRPPSHPNQKEIYLNQLIDQGVVSHEEGVEMEKEFDDMLQERLAKPNKLKRLKSLTFWRMFGEILENLKRKISLSLRIQGMMKKLIQLAKKINYLPEGKSISEKY